MHRLALLVSVVAVLVGLAAVGDAASASLQEGTPTTSGATPCAVTGVEENKELVRRYWAEVWRPGGEAAVAELLAPDEVHHWGVVDDTVGHEAFAERLRGFLVAFPDLRFTVDQLVGEGDLVVSRWTATGTQTGAFFDIAPTGTAVEWTGINVFRFACGRIAESWGQADHLGLRRQLGAIPPVATPAAGVAASTAG